MNALDHTADNPAPATPRATAHAAHPTHKFQLLLKREFWEHKGGFFWAPLIAGGISLLLTLMAIIVGLVAARRAAAAGDLQFDGVNVSGMDMGQLLGRMDAQQMESFGRGMDLTLFLSSMWPFIVLGFVVFFYCLGALYDDRKDRSVLFWKSLPLSDSQTVLSKVVSAGLVAPVLATLAAVATMLGFAVIVSIVVILHGGNAWTMVWGPANPLMIIGGFIAAIPVYALWALPTIGWLLLCSAFARTKPFLWAIMVPLFAGVFVSWFDLMELFDLDSSWFWSNIVGRTLLGTVPGIEMVYRDDFSSSMSGGSPEFLLNEMSAASVLTTLTMPGLWIGVIAGAAMILGAIRLRRWRDEG